MIVRAYLKDRSATDGRIRDAVSPDVDSASSLKTDPRAR